VYETTEFCVRNAQISSPELFTRLSSLIDFGRKSNLCSYTGLLFSYHWSLVRSLVVSCRFTEVNGQGNDVDDVDDVRCLEASVVGSNFNI
jgi:hypothetical protein